MSLGFNKEVTKIVLGVDKCRIKTAGVYVKTLGSALKFTVPKTPIISIWSLI
jgi:hypothetical protein